MNERSGLVTAVVGVAAAFAVVAVVVIGAAAGAVFGWMGSSGSTPPSSMVGMSDPLVPSVYEPMFRAAAERFGIPEALLLGVAAQESSFDPNAESSAGAMGMMQMLPATFQEWAARAGFPANAGPTDPSVEIPVAAAMLAADGATANPAAALGAYNHDSADVAMVLRRTADYAAWLGGPRPTGRPPATGWPWGECTWYVAAQRSEMGAPVTWSGDAWEWIANAQAQGVQLTTMPRRGEIVVYARGHGYDASAGHVAIVTAITDTSYTVSEANVKGLGVVDSRTIAWPDDHVEGFVP